MKKGGPQRLNKLTKTQSRFAPSELPLWASKLHCFFRLHFTEEGRKQEAVAIHWSKTKLIWHWKAGDLVPNLKKGKQVYFVETVSLGLAKVSIKSPNLGHTKCVHIFIKYFWVTLCKPQEEVHSWLVSKGSSALQVDQEPMDGEFQELRSRRHREAVFGPVYTPALPTAGWEPPGLKSPQSQSPQYLLHTCSPVISISFKPSSCSRNVYLAGIQFL